LTGELDLFLTGELDCHEIDEYSSQQLDLYLTGELDFLEIDEYSPQRFHPKSLQKLQHNISLLIS
jgi:hypothetical protein